MNSTDTLFESQVPGLPNKTTSLNVTITKDSTWFYQCGHTWHNINHEDKKKLMDLAESLLGPVGMDRDGNGEVGPITFDEMVEFEVGMTDVSKRLNMLAIEEGKQKGIEVSKAQAALDKL